MVTSRRNFQDVIFLKSDYPKEINKLKPAKISFFVHLLRFGFATLGKLFPDRAARLVYQFFATPRVRAKHKVSDEILEKARLFEFLYGGKILKGYEWGNGPQNILLVHGWESRGTALRSFVPKLVERGYKVIAFDGPAHGNSDGTQTNLYHFGGAVKAILNHIGNVKGIIAHSFGGASTVYTLANLDKRSIDKLILIGTPSKMANVISSVEQLFKLPEIVSAKFKKILEQQLNLPLEEVDVSQAFNKIKVNQSLIVHDREDAVVPFDSAKEIVKNWRNCRLLVTEGYGHNKLMKNPDVVNEVVRFINET